MIIILQGRVRRGARKILAGGKAGGEPPVPPFFFRV